MRALAFFAILVIAGPALAQSKRYPPDPVDPDREAEAHSKLWEDALDPGRSPYQQLVREAKQLADERTPDANNDALAKLDKAIAILPHGSDAYIVRGELQLRLQRWDKCADDLAAAEEHAPPGEAASNDRIARRLELGICQSRAGRLADAERTLVGATAGAQARGSAWMRLGEVRIAMGKLDEAIGALDTALEKGDSGLTALPHYLLAAAYDRARLPGEAEQQMQIAVNTDPRLTTIENPTFPLLGTGEHEYLMGLAYRYGQPQPEYALLYFRRFLKLAPESPWHRRAEEHAHELAAIELPQTVTLRQRLATQPDLDVVRAALVKQMPGMRACMTKLPTTAVEVVITKDGPRTPDTVRDRPRYNRIEKAGVSVTERLELDDVPHDGIEAASRCIEAIADRAAVPVPKERDSYYQVSFVVIAP